MIICPNCGFNPQEKPYCMEPTHCPKCGYIFNNNGGIKMTNERIKELYDNMLS